MSLGGVFFPPAGDVSAITGFVSGLDNLVARLASKRSWVTSPGFDVIWIGDSIPVTGSTSTGSSSNGRYRSTAVHTLSKRLQAKYNPNGVTGGLGYIPFYAGGSVPTTTIANGGDTICTTADPLNVASGDTAVQWSTSAVGTGGRDVGIASGSTRYIGGQLQSSLSYAAQDRALLESLIVVGRKFATGGILAIDAGSGWVGRGSGTILSTTWDTAAATEYGARSGLLTCSTTLGDHRIVFRGAASGNPVFADGAIYFIGDSVSGVRSHGLNNPGSRLNLYGANSQSATINPWTAMNGNPATNGGLVIISSLINEAVAAVSAANYNTTLVDWIDKILARPSTPGVLLIVPVEPAFIGGLTEANFDALVTQIYTTAATYAAAGSPVALLDLNVAFGLNGSRYDGLTRRLGVLNNDYTHLSNYGHSRLADAVFSLFELAWG